MHIKYISFYPPHILIKQIGDSKFQYQNRSPSSTFHQHLLIDDRMPMRLDMIFFIDYLVCMNGYGIKLKPHM